MLDDLKFINQKDPHDELGIIERRWRDKSDLLAATANTWRADNRTKANLAKQVAEFLAGKTAVIYSGDRDLADAWNESIARRARNRVFAKAIAGSDETEIAAWSSHPIDKPFGILLLRTKDETNATKQAIEQMKTELSGRWPHPLEVEIESNDRKWGKFLGEMSASYLAILNGVPPAK